MKYLVQSILQDGDAEKVIDSLKTDDTEQALNFLMQRHRHNTHYVYIAMEIETQRIVIRTTKNKYGW